MCTGLIHGLALNRSLSSDLWTLKSFVCHKGDHANSGHYIAYVRFSEHDAASHLWLRLDDDKDPNIQVPKKLSCFQSHMLVPIHHLIRDVVRA